MSTFLQRLDGILMVDTGESCLEVWQQENQLFSDEVMPKTFQPEDNLYAACYLRVGRSVNDNYIMCL